MSTSQEKIYQIALSLVKGVGSVLWQKLIGQAGSAQAVFQSSEHRLRQIMGTSKELAYEILKKNTVSLAKEIFSAYQQAGIQVIAIGEPKYPERLSHTPQAPPLLYCHGNLAMHNARSISIVGTRKPTPYGKKVVEKLVEELKTYQVVIVSGLAYGIDIHTHQEALKQGLVTIGVLASSLDAIYPIAHKKVAENILAQGSLVSENALKAELKTYHFPARNRIIAGISDATIIIEAGEKSGALITANFANAYHREVFAIPGAIDAAYSKGTNSLIKNHQAHLVTCASDVAYIMGWELPKIRSGANSTKQTSMVQLTLEEQNVIQILEERQTAVHIDALSQQSQISLALLKHMLLQLELKNIVQCLPGSRYSLVS
jgi:DNA processing protein